MEPAGRPRVHSFLRWHPEKLGTGVNQSSCVASVFVLSAPSDQK